MQAASQNIGGVQIVSKAKHSFGKLWDRDDLSDVKLCCDQHEFQVHRFLLAACSPYFRKLFQTNPTTNLKIVIEDVHKDHLERMLLYMYRGAIEIKDENLEEFCTLLEKFEIPLPEDIDVDVSSDDGGENTDEFVSHLQDRLDQLTTQNLDQQTSEIKNIIETSPETRIDALIDMILRMVCQFGAAGSNSILFSLVEQLVSTNTASPTRNGTKYLQEQLGKSAICLLKSMSKSVGVIQPELVANVNPAISLDRLVNQIEMVRFHCTNGRCRRVSHFVGHLYNMNLVSLSDVFDISKMYPELKQDLLNKGRRVNVKCCDFEMPRKTRKVLQSAAYHEVKNIEEHLFWIQYKANRVNIAFDNIGQQGNGKQPQKRTETTQQRIAQKAVKKRGARRSRNKKESDKTKQKTSK